MPRLGKLNAPVDHKFVANKLKELRKRRGLTQLEVAAQLGISQALLSQYERGETRIHAVLVAAFSKVLKVPADEILGLKESKENGFFKDRRFLRRLQQIEALPKRKKQALLTTLDAFLRGEQRR